VSLDEILARLTTLPDTDRRAAVDAALKVRARMKWMPNPGPQTDAYLSLADELLYGGEVGGGKTDILIGLAVNVHHRSLILRRLNKEVAFLVERTEEILGDRRGYNGQKGRWHLSDGKLIGFGGCQHPGDERGYKGERKDFLGIDEASEFLEGQIDFLLGWLGTGDPEQRVRVVFATNPPTTVDGEWVTRWFAPWLDPTHPRYPQPYGKLLYYVRDGDRFRWLDTPEPVEVNGRIVKPLSRTFIRSGLKDNPYYAKTDYANRVAQMPEELRLRYEKGDFTAGLKDQEFQLIPTAWIIAAQDRWSPDGFKTFAMTAMALDPAGGGRDTAELCWRHGGWYAPLISAKGEETADGSASAATVVRYRRDNAPVVVDAGGGYGGAAGLRLKDNGIAVVQFNGASASMGRTHDGTLRFVNKRAEAWWRMREELDPDQEGGSAIALPPDPELRADLAAPTYEVRANGILIESKDELRKRLGRSPGKGDAAVMCLSEGNAAVRKLLRRDGGRHPKISIGYAKLKKRYAR
jgi:hypothetical protein